MNLHTFFIFAAITLTASAADQALPLEGSRNFRDLGSYPTMDGKKVKSGRVFRSDALAKLTDKDYETLASLNIRTVCDFRMQSERDREPTKWKGTAPEFLLLDIGGAPGTPKGQDPSAVFLKPLLEGKATPEQMAQMMQANMVDMAYNGGSQIGTMLRRLISSGDPLLFHCTAGKDRTGLATAFLLTLLGVKKEIIEADYLLINKLMPPDQTAPAMAKRLEAMVGAPMSPELVKPLLGTRIEWLRAAFSGIDQKSRSFDQYRREVLGLSDEDVAVLKLRLLE